MVLLKKQIEDLLAIAVRTAYPELENFIPEITEATQEHFGHYQCNNALKLAKILKKSPQEIGEKIVAALSAKDKCRFEVTSTGFINITLLEKYVTHLLNEQLTDERLGVALPEKREKIVVDFSCPNIAKEMHVGHLRSTIIGDSIARLFEFLGHDVLRLNHIGDWGTAFGMLIAYMRKEVPEVIQGNIEADLPSLMEWYKASKKRFDEDEAFKTEARLSIVALQQGDKESLRAWRKICEISRKGYGEVYKLLDVSLVERGESFYNSQLENLTEELWKKGVITLSEGAKCIFIEGESIPLMVQKSDGGYGYDATDLAAMRHRIEEEQANRIIIVTDNGQSLHFRLIYSASIKAGFLNPIKVRFDHVPFGLVLGPDGKKFKTRAGTVEKLADLLYAAIQKAREILQERGNGEVEELAPILGIDAVKYADLSCNRAQDYLFSYDRMLRFEGNTAAFILYSYVRVQGIKRKVLQDIEKLRQTAQIDIQHPSEMKLAVQLLRFHEILEEFSQNLYPHILTDYLYQLAQKFNLFFRDCRVEGSKEEASRLLLADLTARTLHRGMEILGLKVAEKM